MKRSIPMMVALLFATSVFAGATSVNMFGVLKVLSTTTNTIVTIPWTDYSQKEVSAAPIFSPKLVKPTNLTIGDAILWHRGDGKFYSWILNENREWEKTVTVTSIPFSSASSTEMTADGVRIPRGYGFWLQRQHPFDIVDGKKVPVPFWVFGQSVANSSTATIGAGTVECPCCTMLANPWGGKVNVNSLPWKNIHEGTGKSDCDTLIIPNGYNGSDYVYRMNHQWTLSRLVTYQDAKGRTRSKTEYITKIEIPVGQGFWYVRRGGGETTLEWPRQEPEAESATTGK